MSDFLQVTQDSQPAGFIQTVRVNGKSATSVFNQENLPEESRTFCENLIGVTTSIAGNASDWISELNESGIRKRIRDVVARARPSFQNAIRAGITVKQDVAKRLATYDALPATVDGNLESEWRAQYKALDDVGRADFIENSDKSRLAALLRAGAGLFRGPAGSHHYEQAVKRYRTVSLIEKLGSQAEYAMPATVNNPLAGATPDVARAVVKADEQLKGLENRSEQVESLANFLSHYAVLVSVMIETTPKAAFEYLAGIGNDL